jgi:hypothetical protein
MVKSAHRRVARILASRGLERGRGQSGTCRDYHLVSSQGVLQSVAFLVEHLPAGVRLALATRARPRTAPGPAAGAG